MATSEPQGVPFFNIKSGDTHYAKLEAQIQAYINSSDMGINASREQDFGWRLGADWVKKVKEFRRDEGRMRDLTSRNGGQRVTTPQILYAIYGEQLRAWEEQVEEDSTPFEQDYLRDISDQPQAAAPAPLPQTEEVPLDVADEDLEPGDAPASEQVEEVPAANGTSKPTKPATQKQK